MYVTLPQLEDQQCDLEHIGERVAEITSARPAEKHREKHLLGNK